MDAAELMASQITEVTLPSKGLLYDGKLPEGKIRVRPLTTREEKLLLSSKPDVRNKLIHTIVEDCIVEEDRRKMPFSKYLVGDVIYLFIFVRSLTYGADYTFMPACRYCGKPMKVDLRLPHDLGIYRLTDDTVEPFVTKLPVGDTEVGLRLFRISDERAVLEYMKRHKDEGAEVTYRLARHISAYDGQPVENPEDPEFLRMVGSMHARNAEHIRETIVDNDCGVDLQLDRDCTECGRANEDIYFEMTVDFFRSQSARVRRRRGTVG